MAVPALLNQVAGYMAKAEAVYGTAETLTNTTDGKIYLAFNLAGVFKKVELT